MNEPGLVGAGGGGGGGWGRVGSAPWLVRGGGLPWQLLRPDGGWVGGRTEGAEGLAAQAAAAAVGAAAVDPAESGFRDEGRPFGLAADAVAGRSNVAAGRCWPRPLGLGLRYVKELVQAGWQRRRRRRRRWRRVSVTLLPGVKSYELDASIHNPLD